MASIVEIYTGAVRANLKPLFANWEPGKPVELGDYGILSGDAFIHIGNIKDLGMRFGVRDDASMDRKYFNRRIDGDPAAREGVGEPVRPSMPRPRWKYISEAARGCSSMRPSAGSA